MYLGTCEKVIAEHKQDVFADYQALGSYLFGLASLMRYSIKWS